MKALTTTLRPTRMAIIVAAASLFPLAAHAQGASMSEMQARYKEDLQRCESLSDPESKQTCRREAGAAMQEARRNRLVTNQSDTTANASARCARLPGQQRADCERLMSDSGAVEHGSVSGGGVIRELSITVPADSTTPGSYTPAPQSYGTQTAPGAGYGTQAVPPPGYGTQPAPATGGYGAQPAPATGGYGTQPAPAQGGYGSQPAPAPGGYGSMPAR